MEKSAATPHAPGVPGGNDVAVEFEDGIAWVRLNRPQKRNAMSVALAAEMNQILDALETGRHLGVDDRVDDQRALVGGVGQLLARPTAPLFVLGEHVENDVAVDERGHITLG